MNKTNWMIGVLWCCGLIAAQGLELPWEKEEQPTVREEVKAAPRSPLDEIRSTSEAGDRDAQYSLALAYFHGHHGLSKDMTLTAYWVRQAAEQGHMHAQYNMGWLYQEGVGVTQSHSLASEWYRKAAEAGLPEAQLNLGNSYRDGRGVEQNHREAVRWYRRGVEEGFGPTQNALGFAYWNAQGVERNDAEAVRLWRLSAAQNNYNAMFNLGLAYETGRGVSRDLNQARAWYQRASAGGHAGAADKLQQLFPEETP